MQIFRSWFQFQSGSIYDKSALVQVMAGHQIGVVHYHADGLVQDCSNSIANKLVLLQSCTKPLMWTSNDLVHWCIHGLSSLCVLTHCGPVMPHGNREMGPTLAQVMTCCLTAPSHYLNQCWLIIKEVHWHSSEGNFRRDTSAINHQS